VVVGGRVVVVVARGGRVVVVVARGGLVVVVVELVVVVVVGAGRVSPGSTIAGGRSGSLEPPAVTSTAAAPASTATMVATNTEERATMATWWRTTRVRR